MNRIVFAFEFRRTGQRWEVVGPGRVECYLWDEGGWHDGEIRLSEASDLVTVRGHSLGFWEDPNFEQGWRFVKEGLELRFPEAAIIGK